MDANTAMAEDIINEVFDFIEGHTDSHAINSFFLVYVNLTQNMTCAELTCDGSVTFDYFLESQHRKYDKRKGGRITGEMIITEELKCLLYYCLRQAVLLILHCYQWSEFYKRYNFLTSCSSSSNKYID